MAQLGDLARARTLLRRATRAFSPRETLARARCVIAEAEVAFASRDLEWSAKSLRSALATLEQHGDLLNATHARLLESRRLLLIGRLDDAERMLRELDLAKLSHASSVVYELVVAGIAVRRLRTKEARAALARAERFVRRAGIPALAAEVESAVRLLSTPAARLVSNGDERSLVLEEVESLLASDALVVDACRFVLAHQGKTIALATRPVLFALARALGEAWPNDVAREALIARAFGSRFTDESHRARLRVEVTRLRTKLRSLADVRATKQGFALEPKAARQVVVLARPVEDEHAAVLACLSDGESWSTSALALTLARSQRTVQRALDELATSGKVQSFGRGRARRWVTPPMPGFTTTLLLSPLLPIE